MFKLLVFKFLFIHVIVAYTKYADGLKVHILLRLILAYVLWGLDGGNSVITVTCQVVSETCSVGL